MLSKKSKPGKIIFIVGFILFVFGIIFNKSLGLADTPEYLETIALPIIIFGVIMLIISNFFRKSEKI